MTILRKWTQNCGSANIRKLLKRLEAWVGIEPAYADLQSARELRNGADRTGHTCSAISEIRPAANPGNSGPCSELRNYAPASQPARCACATMAP